MVALAQPMVEARGDDVAVVDETASFTWAQFDERTNRCFKVPRSFDFVDEFPRTETGKLEKRKLRDPYWTALDRAI
jgi:acyl-coenzyme A synthetase/AMP-(fatty) acid ligase